MPDNLTPKKMRAIRALLVTGEISKAAEVAHCSRDSIYRWLRDPVFKNKLDIATKDALETLSRRMVALGDKTAAALEDALTYDLNAPSARVQSAKVVIAAIPQLRELASLEEWVTKLEAAQNDSILRR